jgi:hypothetical protein
LIFERGERPAKQKQITVIFQMLKTEEEALVTLRVADKIITVIGDEKELVEKAWNVVKEKMNKQ